MTSQNRNTFDKYISELELSIPLIDGTIHFCCKDEEEYKKLLNVLKSISYMIIDVHSFHRTPIK